MQIHNNTLITECSAYDFKEMLEHKKVKSWLKSVSAFANTDGGSLFYGVNDDGVIVGLENPQADADFISEMIKARLDPVPEVQLIPIEHEGHTLIEVKVKAGTLTPYYYYQDGTRTAYTRVGNENPPSVPAAAVFFCSGADFARKAGLSAPSGSVPLPRCPDRMLLIPHRSLLSVPRSLSVHHSETLLPFRFFSPHK